MNTVATPHGNWAPVMSLGTCSFLHGVSCLVGFTRQFATQPAAGRSCELQSFERETTELFRPGLVERTTDSEATLKALRLHARSTTRHRMGALGFGRSHAQVLLYFGGGR